MNFSVLIIGITIVFLLQVGLFIWARKVRKKEKQENVLLKYNINTRSEAWKLLNDPDVPEEDKARIQKIFEE